MMILYILLFLISTILALIQSHIITKASKKIYYIPIIVFIISTIYFIYMLIQEDHFIKINGSNFLVKTIQIIIEFLIINLLTFLLYFMAKKPKYRYYLLCFSIIINIFVILLVSNETPTKDKGNVNYIFIADTINDKQSIVDSVNTCYLEGNYYAGYNSYPLILQPNLRIICDVLNLSNMGYYALSDLDIKNIAISLDATKPVTFYDEYLYNKSMILLGVTSDFGLEHFFKDHFNKSNGLFFINSPNEKLMDQLTATLYCIELYNIANIPIPNEKEIKSRIIEFINNDDIFIKPKNSEDCYQMILTESGTILKIAGLLNKSYDLLDVVSKRKEWFEDIIYSIGDNEYNCSQLEIWAKIDIIEINNSLYTLNLEYNDIFPYNCLSEFICSDATFESENFFHDSQYLYDLAKLNALCNNDIFSTDFITKYIKTNINTHFRQQYRAKVLPQDTFYGVTLAKMFNFSINNDKIINSALEWINSFIENDNSNIELNSQALYAIRILKLLDYNINFETLNRLQNSITNKLGSNKFISPDYQKKYLLLHEFSLLYELKFELDPTTQNVSLPKWIVNITEEDLSKSNLNIAYDLVKIIDISDPSYKEYLHVLNAKLNKEIARIHKVVNEEDSEELLDEIIRIYNIMNIVGTPNSEIEEFLNSFNLTSIYIDKLSVAFNITYLKYLKSNISNNSVILTPFADIKSNIYRNIPVIH